MKKDHIKVKDNHGLVREKHSNAILNTDPLSLNKYRQERNEKAKILSMLNEHEQVKNDVQEIKEMLKALLGKS